MGQPAIYFDHQKARRVRRFFNRILTHPKQRYAPFHTIGWQNEFLGNVFGRVNEEGERMIRRAYLEIPKKNGKSETAAGIGVYCLAGEDEPAAEIYGAATTKEQASIVFRTAASMVEHSPELHRVLKVIRSSKTIIKRDDPNSFFKVISADGDAQDGANPYCVIIDELHRWKTGKQLELFEVLTRGGIARKEPIVIEITTAGSTEDESPLCWAEHEYTRNIEDGIFTDPHFYGKIYAADPGDDWTLPATWIKANPSLTINGGFLGLEVIEAKCIEAKNRPAMVPAFKRFHLGLWGSSEEQWMPKEVWDLNAKPIIRSLAERPCYLGLDLSSRIDLTSLVALFPDAEDGSYDVLPFFWMAQERVQERQLADHVPYGTWIEDELMLSSEGDVIDQRDILQKILWCRDVFDVKAVAFDPAHALQLSIELSDTHGMTCVPVPQRYSHMSEPSKKLMDLALNGKLRHGGHKVLAWNSRCLRMKSDGQDNYRPVKPDRLKSSKRIDGMVALIIALSRAMFHTPSVYETRGLATT